MRGRAAEPASKPEPRGDKKTNQNGGGSHRVNVPQCRRVGLVRQTWKVKQLIGDCVGSGTTKLCGVIAAGNLIGEPNQPHRATGRNEMNKINWNSLTKQERVEYMQLQMSPSGSYDRSGYLPDDCGECGACGQPTLGAGWCDSCYRRFRELDDKLRGVSDEQADLEVGKW